MGAGLPMYAQDTIFHCLYQMIFEDRAGIECFVETETTDDALVRLVATRSEITWTYQGETLYGWRIVFDMYCDAWDRDHLCHEDMETDRRADGQAMGDLMLLAHLMGYVMCDVSYRQALHMKGHPQ